jgi:hypothetical protein
MPHTCEACVTPLEKLNYGLADEEELTFLTKTKSALQRLEEQLPWLVKLRRKKI